MIQSENKYNKSLLKGATFGDFNVVRDALENGADVDAVDYEGNTALITVTIVGVDENDNNDSYCDYLKVIKLLFSYNADITKQNYEEYTAMTYVCMSNNLKMVNLLLERWVWLCNQNIHINVRKKNNDIKTGMVFACYYGKLEIMKILFESNIIDVNTAMYQVNEEGLPRYDDLLYYACTSPLLITACFHKHTNIITYLLNLDNIDVNVRDTLNMTPLMVASKHGFIEVVTLLLNHPNIDVYKSNERHCYRIAPSWTFNPIAPTAPTALTYAWDKDHSKVLEELVFAEEKQ
tara:strand:- start:12936 stop:13808 length:873 start_codon:yes stop_codon:yes gene_type:complete